MVREEECRNAGQAEQANLISFCTREGQAQATGSFCVGSPDIGKRRRLWDGLKISPQLRHES